MNFDDIENRFAFHPATTKEKKAEHGSIRKLFLDAAHELNELLPGGREAALAITKLEEAMFWANAAIARQPETYVPTRHKGTYVKKRLPFATVDEKGEVELTGEIPGQLPLFWSSGR